MSIQDSHIDWMRKRIWLTAHDIQGVQADDGTILKTVLATQVEKPTGFGSWEMIAGELIYGWLPVPYDLDPRWPLGFKIWWSVDASGASVATWIILFDVKKLHYQLAAPTTALDTAIAACAGYEDDGTALADTEDDYLQITARGIKNSIGISRKQIEDGAMMMFSIELDAITNADGDAAQFIGMMMDYVPMKTVGTGSDHDRSLRYTGE